MPKIPKAAYNRTDEQTEYLDYLRLNSIANRLGCSVSTSKNTPTQPLFEYVGKIASKNDFVGIEHFYDFNQGLSISEPHIVGISYKEAVGYPSNYYEMLEELAIKQGLPQNFYDGRPTATSKFTSQHCREAETAIRAALRGTQANRLIEREVIDMHLPAIEQPATRSLASAELRAMSAFVIRAGDLIEEYGSKLGYLGHNDISGANPYFCGALATQLALQIET